MSHRSIPSYDDTIAAVSTPAGVGALNIVRLSGPNAIRIADAVFAGGACRRLQSVPTHTVHHGYIIDRQENIDEVLVTVMRSPRTYTREDTVEISCHGGICAARRILECLIKNGARTADPGEFTKRAFLNGRIDLTQAESVIDMISAETETERRLAINHLTGALREAVAVARDKILTVHAPLEAAVDFPEEDIPGMTPEDIRMRIREALNAVDTLIKTKDDGCRVRNGISLVIAGGVNAGKSSLFNLLLKENRSIVTHIPGTTRDVLEENAVIDGILYKISDTAGLRKAKGVVEKIGIGLSEQRIADADIILYLIDNKKGISAADKDFCNSADKAKLIVVINKTDLSGKTRIAESRKTPHTVRISAKKRLGIDKLLTAINKKGEKLIPRPGTTPYLINERQYQALLNARDHLEKAVETAAEGLSYEFIAMDLKGALERLGEITGENATDQTLEAIFSRFCIGK